MGNVLRERSPVDIALDTSHSMLKFSCMKGVYALKAVSPSLFPAISDDFDSNTMAEGGIGMIRNIPESPCRALDTARPMTDFPETS